MICSHFLYVQQIITDAPYGEQLSSPSQTVILHPLVCFFIRRLNSLIVFAHYRSSFRPKIVRLTCFPPFSDSFETSLPETRFRIRLEPRSEKRKRASGEKRGTKKSHQNCYSRLDKTSNTNQLIAIFRDLGPQRLSTSLSVQDRSVD